MGEYRSSSSSVLLCDWSWGENKLFELALAVVEEGKPNRWELVAAMVGSGRSAEEVEKHYKILLEDLKCIESGNLDHRFGTTGTAADAHHHLYLSSTTTTSTTQSICWTDEDQKRLVQLGVN